MTSLRQGINRALVGAAVTALSIAGAVVSAPLASADPDAVKEAQAKLEALQQQHSELDLKYAQLDGQLTQANGEVATLSKDLTAQQQKVASMKGVVVRIALTRHQQGSLSNAAQLLAAPDDQSFMKQLATLDSVGTRTQALVQEYQTEQAKVAGTQAALVTKRNEIASAKAKQAEIITQHVAKEDEAEKVLAKLTKEEQERLAKVQQEQAEAQARAVAAREQAASRSNQRSSASPSTSSSSSTSKTPSTSKSTNTTKPSPTTSVPSSGRASVAVSAALSKVGHPYVMGATGPNAFDCSGLTSWAWRQAGVSLPRTSQAQYGAGVRVSASDLRPGDLVFYYSGISHVGIYIGNGQIVHAANPRRGVTTIGLYSMPFMGARRVG